ncbi:hypothetical protein ACI798_02725 [Geodermatophilus sp. SYSU D01045]
MDSPVLDADGRAVGVLHHVEDVSRLVRGTALERLVAGGTAWVSVAPGAGPLREALERARRDAHRRQERTSTSLGRSVEAIERVRRVPAANDWRSPARRTDWSHPAAGPPRAGAGERPATSSRRGGGVR